MRLVGMMDVAVVRRRYWSLAEAGFVCVGSGQMGTAGGEPARRWS